MWEVATAALKQPIPTRALRCSEIIADSFQPATIEKLKSITGKTSKRPKSTKSKALNKAMEQLGDGWKLPWCWMLIILWRRFLTKVNTAFDNGFIAVQDTALQKISTIQAVLDAVSEEINNHIFRKGTGAGLSSYYSGMAFDYHF